MDNKMQASYELRENERKREGKRGIDREEEEK
jgi:hypothetical protein